VLGEFRFFVCHAHPRPSLSPFHTPTGTSRALKLQCSPTPEVRTLDLPDIRRL
jgi:hypothetical protein